MPMKPTDLASYKSEAEECLTYCTQLKECFRGCLDECTKALGPPQCVGFAMRKDCNDACNSLSAPFTCLASVTPANTADCHTKFAAVKIPDP